MSSTILADEVELSLTFAQSITTKYREDSFWKRADIESEFPAQFPGLLNLYLTSPPHQQLAVSAILCCFHRLDIAFVRRECLRLVSLACWKSLSEERLLFEFERQPRLKDNWHKAKEVTEGAFFGRLIDDCIISGTKVIVDLLSLCLLQWPTRRYLSVLLDDKCFVLKCRQKDYEFTEQIDDLLYGSAVYDPASEKAEWNDEDHLEDFYERIEQFQMTVYTCDENNPLASAPLFELTEPKTSTVLLERHLTAPIRALVCQTFGWQDDDNLVSRLVHSFSLRLDNQNSKSVHGFPELEDTKHIELMKQQLLPLTPQLLNKTEYLTRMLKLLKFEFTKSLDDLLSQSLKRCKPVMDKKLGLVFDGWFRYASFCHHVEGNIYQFTLSPMTSEGVISEWQRVKIGDFLYLCKLVQDGDNFKYEYARVARVTGIVKESRPAPKQATNVISEAAQTQRTSTKLLFTLDRQIEDVIFAIRLDPKDNSLLFMESLGSSLKQHSTTLSASIGMDSFLYGQKSGTVETVKEWIDGQFRSLLIKGPPNSGKTTALKEILKAKPESKVIILVPTVEQADLFTQQLLRDNLIDKQRFVRLGYSPSNLSIGRVTSYLEWRNQLLATVEEYFDSIEASTATASSCEAAIACLEQIPNIDERGLEYLSQLKQVVPLEYIQNDDHREAYLLKYHANVALMTYGYAATHAKLFSEINVDFMLMDDCNLVTEVMAMIPLLQIKGNPRVVMFGDAQVEPVCEEDLLVNYNFGSSLFRRMSLLDCLPTVTFETVHNVPKDLTHWFSNFTIGDCIVDFIEVECDNPEQIIQTKQNVLEAEELVEYYLAEFASECDCVCLSPYNAQCDLLSDVFSDKQVDGKVPMIYTIDKLSGSHADVVLCSLTVPRLNSFVRDRLLMLLTRGLKKLIIFHSPQINLLSEKQ